MTSIMLFGDALSMCTSTMVFVEEGTADAKEVTDVDKFLHAVSFTQTFHYSGSSLFGFISLIRNIPGEKVYKNVSLMHVSGQGTALSPLLLAFPIFANKAK